MYDIDHILKLMSWNSSQEEQFLGKNLARKITCLKVFFQPITEDCSKDVWENCAIVLCEHTDAQLLPYLADMMLWLQDGNWPGAALIQRRLIQFEEVKILAKTVRDFTIALDALEEHTWLATLAELLNNQNLARELDAFTLNLLQRYG